jgi:hypothetical protein
VDLKETTQYKVEQFLNRQVLNFGISNDFGPLQQQLLYKEYSPKFCHSIVVIFFLPANDFTDNDKEYWKNINIERYRPYYTESLSPFYFHESYSPTVKGKKIFSSFISGAYNLFRTYSWGLNIYRSVRYVFKSQEIKLSKSINYSGYFDSKIKQQKFVINTFREIYQESKKTILIVTIPSIKDIEKSQSLGKTYRDQFWYSELLLLSENNDFHFIDLMDFIPSNHHSLFLECDPHWSSSGNKWCAEVISDYIQSNDI